MAEVITETILPGTYIEVRAEGLLTVGAIATGNVGLIGTAERGDDGIETLSSFEDGRARFGEPGPWDPAAPESNLTLVRALRYLTENGARTIYARRVLPSNATPATMTLMNDSNNPIMTLQARTSGTWGNRLQVRVEEADAQELVVNEVVEASNGVFTLSAQAVFKPEVPANGNGSGESPSIGKVVAVNNGMPSVYQLRHSSPTAQSVQVNESTRVLTFAAAPAVPEVRVSYLVPQQQLRRVTIRYGNVQEVYTVPSLSYLEQVLEDEENPSKLVTVVSRTGDGLPALSPQFQPFANGANGTPTLDNYKEALDSLVEQNIQLLVVAGLPFSEIRASILGHVEKTENLGRERIAIVGADSSDVEKVLENANEVADKRVVLVAPGLRERNGGGRTHNLPPYFAAAAVAGKLAGLAPHVSLTNKTLAGIEGLGAEYNYGDLKSLVQNRVLTLQTKRGTRVVKGISTDDEAFKQISIRRIVDYAKEGTRLGANQYIGKLNNRRVRENLRSTLDGFLAYMLSREYLTGYQLEVYADRQMEIRGEVQVVMDLNPTFSIDVIRVIMNLS